MSFWCFQFFHKTNQRIRHNYSDISDRIVSVRFWKNSKHPKDFSKSAKLFKDIKYPIVIRVTVYISKIDGQIAVVQNYPTCQNSKVIERLI